MKGPQDKSRRPFAASQPPLSRSDELRMTSQLSKICVMGATGFLGRALCAALERSGATVHRYSRSARPGFASWDPASGEIESEPLEAADAVVNLSGEDIAAARWTAHRKKVLRDSRIGSTQLLVQTLGKLKQPPKVLINASAVGFYGHRGEDAVAENSPVGTGFLAELCQQWEATAMQASAHGVRVVIPRLGIVLSKDGGALARMLPAFKLGVAGRLGSGQQFMSWISMLDAVSVIRFLMSATEINGVVNAVAPEPATNEEFTHLLGRIVRRPTLLPLPVFALKAALGELSQVLLEGANVRPRVLEHAGFRFDYPRLEDALEALLA
jgi:uncharacterized protein (TIGR01777 family)